MNHNKIPDLRALDRELRQMTTLETLYLEGNSCQTSDMVGYRRKVMLPLPQLKSPLPNESEPSLPEFVPTTPDTPHHFFYEPNPLPNAVRMFDDMSYHVSDWSTYDSFSHYGDSGSDETDVELWDSRHSKLFTTGARIGEPLMQQMELLLELGRPY